MPGFCPSSGALLWYTFTTNSIGGDVDIFMTNLNCNVGPGFDDEMSMVVLAGDGGGCMSSFAAVSGCVLGNTDFMASAPNLMPNTVYWLLVGGIQNGGATSPANCSFFLEISGLGVDVIDVDFDAGDGFEIQEGETVQLNATGPPGNCLWIRSVVGLSADDVPNPFATPQSSMTYRISKRINGCDFIDSVRVEVIRLINPPNTFTPNDDGFNDTWEILGIEDFPNAQVVVFDRWGQKVFSSSGYTEEWDGTRNGKVLNTSTYYYVIRLNRLEGQVPPITGSITIVK